MRSSGQISRSPREWHDHQEEERRRNLAAFLRLTASARASGELWVAWIDAGCPPLSEDEYERHQAERETSGRRARRPATV